MSFSYVVQFQKNYSELLKIHVNKNHIVNIFFVKIS